MPSAIIVTVFQSFSGKGPTAHGERGSVDNKAVVLRFYSFSSPKGLNTHVPSWLAPTQLSVMIIECDSIESHLWSRGALFCRHGALWRVKHLVKVLILIPLDSATLCFDRS